MRTLWDEGYGVSAGTTLNAGGTLISPVGMAALRKARPDLTVLPAEPVDDEP